MGKDEAVKMLETAGWRVAEGRGRRSRADTGDEDEVEGGYQIGDGVRSIGEDDLSYGRYLRDCMRVQRKDGKGEVEVESFIVTAMNADIG